MSIFDELILYALIDLDAVVHNVRAVKQYIGPKVELMAVLKADAYGHGAVPVARTALASGATRLVVARADEGIQLRKAGIGAPILVPGYSLPAEADAFVTHDLIATVNTIGGAQALSARAEALGKMATIHVKVDSGMGRYGLLPDEVLPFLEQISRLPNLDLEGLFTHFATAEDRDKSYARQQLATFNQVREAARQAGYVFRLIHAANSAAALDLPETHFDAVRAGGAIYGLRPSADVSEDVPLTPILSLKGRVARVRTLPPGSGIGYGLTYVTTAPTRIVLIPVGYGDGYHRALSNRGVVLVRGRRAPIIGRVSMDQITVDATAIEGVSQDDEVVLIGQQGGEIITADEVARLAGTIHYEVTINLLPRVPRVYLRDGQVVEVSRPIVAG